MPDDLHSPAVIEYARRSADDQSLGRYLRLILGGTVLFYGGCWTIAEAIHYATSNGMLQTSRLYPSTSGPLPSAANSAAALALIYAGPCILWGRRGAVVRAGLLVQIAAVVALLAFLGGWSTNIGMAWATSAKIDAWQWLASFVASLASLAFPILSGLLARSPVFARIKDVARV